MHFHSVHVNFVITFICAFAILSNLKEHTQTHMLIGLRSVKFYRPYAEPIVKTILFMNIMPYCCKLPIDNQNNLAPRNDRKLYAPLNRHNALCPNSIIQFILVAQCDHWPTHGYSIKLQFHACTSIWKIIYCMQVNLNAITRKI